MQKVQVMAFRKRLKKRGYKDISIIQKKDDNGKVIPLTYIITAQEPLTKETVSAVYTIDQMIITFR